MVAVGPRSLLGDARPALPGWSAWRFKTAETFEDRKDGTSANLAGPSVREACFGPALGQGGPAGGPGPLEGGVNLPEFTPEARDRIAATRRLALANARAKRKAKGLGNIGRPKLKPEERRDDTVAVRFKPEDDKLVRAAATADGMELSEWMRMTILDAAFNSAVDAGIAKPVPGGPLPPPRLPPLPSPAKLLREARDLPARLKPEKPHVAVPTPILRPLPESPKTEPVAPAPKPPAPALIERILAKAPKPAKSIAFPTPRPRDKLPSWYAQLEADAKACPGALGSGGQPRMGPSRRVRGV